MPVTSETLRLIDQTRAGIEAVTLRQSTTLVTAWARAWNAVATDLEYALLDLVLRAENGRVTRTAAARSQRMVDALARVGGQLDALAEQAGTTITGDLDQVVRDAAQAQGAIVASQLPAGAVSVHFVFHRVSEDAVAAIVKRSTQRIHKATQPLSRDAQRVMKRELIRGIAVGDNPRLVARRIMRRAEAGFNGGLTRALRISRTEMLDAHRAGTQAGWQQHTDVLKGWMWICELSRRSCPACISLHGSFHPLDEPGPNDHVNGRCTAAPVTRSWKELGFDVPEPASSVRSGGAWFMDQPVTVQREILGPGRYAAWRRGDFPMSQWAVRHVNPGWRDSYQVARVPAAGVAARSVA